MIVSSNGKHIVPDEAEDYLAELSGSIRYFAIKKQMNANERKEFAASAINSVLLGTLWDDIDKGKISTLEGMDSILEASNYYSMKFLETFGKEKTG